MSKLPFRLTSSRRLLFSPTFRQTTSWGHPLVGFCFSLVLGPLSSSQSQHAGDLQGSGDAPALRFVGLAQEGPADGAGQHHAPRRNGEAVVRRRKSRGARRPARRRRGFFVFASFTQPKRSGVHGEKGALVAKLSEHRIVLSQTRP